MTKLAEYSDYTDDLLQDPPEGEARVPLELHQSGRPSAMDDEGGRRVRRMGVGRRPRHSHGARRSARRVESAGVLTHAPSVWDPETWETDTW